MSHDPNSRQPWHDRIGLVLTLSAFVLLWRIAAAMSPYREGVLGSMNDDSNGVRLGLGLMGLLIVACGLYAYGKVRTPVVLLFALSACAGGLHWGGPIGVADSILETALFLFYFVASSLLGQALFLHFTLLFTGSAALIKGRRWLLLYLPTAMAAVVSVGIIALPMESAASKTLRQIFWLLVTSAILYDLAVLATLVTRVVRPRLGWPSRRQIALILGAFGVVGVVTLLPDLGLSVPISGDALSFVHILIPLACAVAIVKSDRRNAPAIHQQASNMATP